MATFATGPVRVSVPATSANLGPGFDTLGLALGLRDVLEGEVVDSGLAVDVHGEGADAVPRDDTHLVVRAMRIAFEAMDAEPPGLALRCRNSIPHGRGLGSSSAAIVGGLFLARALVAGGRLLLDDDALFGLAAGLEGHPDNVAPACFGGFVISGEETESGREGWYAVPAGVDPRIGAVVFVPPTALETTVSRSLLPDSVPHADAALNAGRAALLVAALGGRPEHLLAATLDRLHQEQRRPAMPESLALVDDLRSAGVPAVVSGAGPSVLALTSAGDAEVRRVRARCPRGWESLHLAVDLDGAREGN